MTASKKTLKAAVLTVSLMAAMPSGVALATGIPVVDLTNFAQNIITAIKVTEELKVKYEEMRLNYMMVQNARGNMQHVPSLVSNLSAMEQELGDLHGSLGQAKAVMDQRYRDYATSGTENLNEYYSLEQRRSENNIGDTRARYIRDRNILQNVNDQYRQVQNLQGGIESSTGPLQQQQLLNSHMNIVATQNAQILEMMSAKGISEGVKQNEAQAEEERMRVLRNKMASDYESYHGKVVYPSGITPAKN